MAHVKSFVSPIWCWIALFSLPALAAADPAMDTFLKGVENRYNRAQTLQVLFSESYTGPGQPRRTESGKLTLRKPGRMRWDYTTPQGKLFVSDGKWLWLYTPANNRVERMKLKETDDMRAPLAFLLGKLNFSKEFRDIQARPEGDGTLIAAVPATPNLPYTAVEFLVSPDRQIRRVKVTGYDKSVLEFRFDQEILNPSLDGKMFRFEAPKGAEVVTEATQ
jgi:outer membrane lipoprotein carrier protein